jgi:phospholipid/cholesterol/gamma-HCH transport system permease protein
MKSGENMEFVRKPIEALGDAAVKFVDFIGSISILLGRAVLSSKQLFSRGRSRQMAWENVWAQSVRVGVRSIPIVCLVVFCIGVILALQMTPILKMYGAQDQVATIISIAMLRELGPLVGAIVLTGFAGASIAAEMGTMVVSEEIEALETHAIDPVRFLVMPRLIATAVMTICLAVLADIMGVLGGMVACWATGSVDPIAYFNLSVDGPKLTDFLSGLIKAGVFGAMIALLACHLGLSVSGGAQGVGNATTRTVVLTVVALTFVDLLFTAVFYQLNL